MNFITKKLIVRNLVLPLLLLSCALSASAQTSWLPIGSADYMAAQKAAAAAQAARNQASTGGRTMTQMMGDQSLASDVDTAITVKIPTGFHNVVVFDHQVLITGRVPAQADLAKATAAAGKIAGVKKVWNYLTVGPNETGDQITANAYLASTTKKRLTDRQLQHQDIFSTNVAVGASAGTLYLIGSNAGSKEAIDEVMASMKQTEGVQKVVNLIDQ